MQKGRFRFCWTICLVVLLRLLASAQAKEIVAYSLQFQLHYPHSISIHGQNLFVAEENLYRPLTVQNMPHRTDRESPVFLEFFRESQIPINYSYASETNSWIISLSPLSITPLLLAVFTIQQSIPIIIDISDWFDFISSLHEFRLLTPHQLAFLNFDVERPFDRRAHLLRQLKGQNPLKTILLEVNSATHFHPEYDLDTLQAGKTLYPVLNAERIFQENPSNAIDTPSLSPAIDPELTFTLPEFQSLEFLRDVEALKRSDVKILFIGPHTDFELLDAVRHSVQTIYTFKQDFGRGEEVNLLKKIAYLIQTSLTLEKVFLAGVNSLHCEDIWILLEAYRQNPASRLNDIRVTKVGTSPGVVTSIQAWFNPFCRPETSKDCSSPCKLEFPFEK